MRPYLIYVVEEKRERERDKFFLLLKARRLLCVFCEEENWKIKYAIKFHVIVLILSVYMLEGE